MESAVVDVWCNRRLEDAAARRIMEISVFYERIFSRLDDKHPVKSSWMWPMYRTCPIQRTDAGLVMPTAG